LFDLSDHPLARPTSWKSCERSKGPPGLVGTTLPKPDIGTEFAQWAGGLDAGSAAWEFVSGGPAWVAMVAATPAVTAAMTTVGAGVATALPRLRRACDPTFLWHLPPDCLLPLFLLAPGDLTSVAAALSCGQDIAGDGVFSLAMVTDFDRTQTEDGPWAYRRLFWEARMIGQVLYLEATAAALSGTGIGCYFDDDVHALLGLAGASQEWQSLYHFAVGRAVDDERPSTLPAYQHLSLAR